MGTKNAPAAYDCYANAEPDEPMFVILARDRVGADLVRWWAGLRLLAADPSGEGLAEMRSEMADIVGMLDGPEAVDEAIALLGAADFAQVGEALACADAMDAWRAAHR